MSTTGRRRLSAELKTKVVLGVFRGGQTINELS
jgi:transposase-like protein